MTYKASQLAGPKFEELTSARSVKAIRVYVEAGKEPEYAIAFVLQGIKQGPEYAEAAYKAAEAIDKDYDIIDPVEPNRDLKERY